MKIYKLISYTITALLLILAIYIGIVFSYKAYQKNKMQVYYRQQQEIALKNTPYNQAFSPPKNIPENKPVRILVLGGGGIKGIVSAKILDFIEKNSHERVSDLFDAIYGTSIGGLEATFLTLPDKAGKPKYTAADLIKFIRMDASKVLGVDGFRAFFTGFGFVSPIIDTHAYINQLKDIMG
ncbi:MAG: hypothetical protein K0R49_1844, partial [Burkholderiales bacterium]|nr:hypothetical protein [Burkholderiales bacterium]